MLMLADYHVHTEFSDDSHEPMEEQAKRAVSLGLQEMCNGRPADGLQT